jgi:hypothetical protein
MNETILNGVIRVKNRAIGRLRFIGAIAVINNLKKRSYLLLLTPKLCESPPESKDLEGITFVKAWQISVSPKPQIQKEECYQ